MATVHVSEAEVARDLHAVLAMVRQGVVIVIEQDHRPVAVLRPSSFEGRMLSEVIAELRSRGSNAVMDAAERRKLTAAQPVEDIRRNAGELRVVMPAVTVAEIGHGIYRASTPIS